jgi:hypothetical protein
MSKREIIDRIMRLNRTAQPEFLAEFDEQDLQLYMEHLESVEEPRERAPAVVAA